MQPYGITKYAVIKKDTAYTDACKTYLSISVYTTVFLKMNFGFEAFRRHHRN
jgi:hypothetical protein